MSMNETIRPYLVQSERHPKPTPPDYAAMREYHRRYLQYKGPEGPRRRAIDSAWWLPAKMMAGGFVVVLASMMVIPSLKLYLPAIVALFVFAGALNLAIVLPLAMMIMRGKAGETRTGRMV